MLGLDLSLTATGVADESGTRVIRAPRSEAFGAVRLDYIERELFGQIDKPDVAIVEGFGYMKGNAQFVLEVHGVVKLALYRLGIPFALVPPASLKRFATGAGNADKAHMLAAAIRKFGFQGTDANECDAYLLRKMGLFHYGTLSSTDYQREALAKIDWPALSPWIVEMM